ncbi:MAG: ATP-binding protein [Planctomycetota bacterium]
MTGVAQTGQRSWNLDSVAELLGERAGWPVDKCKAVIDGVTLAVGKALSESREVMIEDFAKIRVSGQNPAGQPYIVPSPEFLGPLAQRFGINNDELDAAVRHYFGILRERLTHNDKLKIDRFLALKVSEENARIVDDPISGQRIVAPAKKVISFMAHPKFKQSVGGAEIAFVPALSLKEGVEQIKTASVVLAVPTRDFFTETIEFHFNRAGWAVSTYQNVDDATGVVTPQGQWLVIVDAALPNWNRLVESIKGNKETSMVPVIVMLPKGADVNKWKEFTIQGNSAIAQPFEIKQLLTIAEAELQRASEEAIFFRQEVMFTFPTTDENIDRANELAAQLFAGSGLDDEGQVALCAAFREGVGNAAQHGNRHRRDKNIHIMFLLDHEKITACIKDDGKGFDWRLYVDDTHGKNAVEKARKRHQEGKLGGLGIMLILKCTDRIEYNESGNQLTEYKYLPGHAPKK